MQDGKEKAGKGAGKTIGQMLQKTWEEMMVAWTCGGLDLGGMERNEWMEKRSLIPPQPQE